MFPLRTFDITLLILISDILNIVDSLHFVVVMVLLVVVVVAVIVDYSPLKVEGAASLQDQ
jgi:hypothetical protein